MRVGVDVERCIASGMCALTAGEVFDQRTEDGRAVVLLPEPPGGMLEAVREAAAHCPTAAIGLWASGT
ncbi:ferredoxin [Streptomyces sp. NPDC006289]|uniref:ferredoxin n=1 Tax=Streptomyces sp. NPDC006289 TaxID=3156744 RepID=UPI0033A0F2A1